MILDYFKDKLTKQYGEKIFGEIIEGMESRHSSFRINSLKSDNQEIENILDMNKIGFENCDWYADAYVVEDERKIKELDIFKDGKIYMQSLSSMLPALVLNPQKGENILDMCAAPGGKTTQMAALSQNEAYITACEKNRIRFDRLKYNIEKQGAKSINVLMQDSSLLSNYFSFDKILLDTPCSGSGTLLKDVESKGVIDKEYVEKLVKVQRKLLDKAITILKSGGILIYSTCSIFKEENEDNISYVLNKYNNLKLEAIDKEQYTNMELLPTIYDETICVKPNEYYEGFFVAKITKN